MQFIIFVEGETEKEVLSCFLASWLNPRLKNNIGIKETVDGAILFHKLNPEEAYHRCPHLKEMLDEMLVLAQASGL